jgi:hypothetical protein
VERENGCGFRRFRGAASRDPGRNRRGLDGLGARHRAILHREAALERPFHLLFNLPRDFVGHFRDLGNDEKFRAIEHALFAEGEVLRTRQERQALEHLDDVVDGARAHPIGVVLEAALPVLMVVDLAVAEEGEQSLDFFVVDGASEADAVDVVDRHENRRLVCDHPEMIEPAGGAEDCLGLDALNDAESVIWVDDLVTNLKCHISPTLSKVCPPRCAPADCEVLKV